MLDPDEFDRESELAAVFGDIARQLQSQDDPEHTWQCIIDIAGDVHPSFKHAAISLVHRGEHVETAAATDDIPRAVDKIQYETRQGPCLSAIADDDMYLAPDLADEHRWPAFTERVLQETNVRSMLSYRLFTADETLGALNLYSDRPGEFDDRAQAFGSVLAAHAAVAMSAAQEHQHSEQLEEALASSREIGIAVGILMVQTRVDRDRAFGVLAQVSMRMNIKLRELARRLVAAEEEASRKYRAG